MRSNPVEFFTQHPWMTLILGLAAIGVVGTAVSPVCACTGPAAAPPPPPAPPTPAPVVPVVTGTSGLGGLHGAPFQGVFKQLGMHRG